MTETNQHDLSEKNRPEYEPANGERPPAEFWDPTETFGFVQKQLPWILAGAVFLLYVLTLCRWLRLEALQTIGLATGWDPIVRPEAPLYKLIGLLLSPLPDSVELYAHNVLAAVFAALTVYFLARILAFWPYDRTPECRERNSHPLAFMESKWAWVPPVLAVLVFATARAPWFHGTVGTGDMFDLFLIAWIAYHLALFRLYDYEDETTPNQGNKYLYRACLLTGLAVTNNYAMIGWSFCVLVAIIWLKGWRIFDLAFLVRCAASFIVGLLAYLILPLYYTITQTAPFSFWFLLKQELAIQKNQFLGYRRELAFLLLLYSLPPIIIAAIRWKRHRAEMGSGELIAMNLLRRVLYLAMAVLALGHFYPRCPWSPGYLGIGTSWLPIYFIAAIALGALIGSAILEFHPLTEEQSRRYRLETGTVTLVLRGLLLLVAPLGLIVSGYLIAINMPYILQQRGLRLKALAATMLGSVSERVPFFISDDYYLLSVINVAAHTQSQVIQPVIMHSGLLPELDYHKQMRAYYKALWPYPVTNQITSGVLLPQATATYLANVSSTGSVYYLTPSFGYFFESVYLEPQGLIYRLRPVGTNFLAGLKWDQGVIHNNERFWNELEARITAFPEYSTNEVTELAYVRLIYSRALNWWGVTLQRNHELQRAEKRFQQALQLYPDNLAAQVNLEFNRSLQQKTLPELDPTQPIDDPRAKDQNWESFLARYGPVDQPRWVVGLAEYYRRAGLARQALVELTRVAELYPEHKLVQLYRRATEATAWLLAGNRTLAERIAEELRAQYPDSLVPLDLLVDIYQATGQINRIVEATTEQLKLDPNYDTARLNLATALIRLNRLDEAIEHLNIILSRTETPKNRDLLIKARFNRAICYLRLGKLSEARQDYEQLLKEARLPVPIWAVYYGLGEIAFRTGDLTVAKNYYERYLKTAPQGTEEFRKVEMRLEEIRKKAGS